MKSYGKFWFVVIATTILVVSEVVFIVFLARSWIFRESVPKYQLSDDDLSTGNFGLVLIGGVSFMVVSFLVILACAYLFRDKTCVTNNVDDGSWSWPP